MTTDVHPTAVIDPRARLGTGVRIGPWCVVEGPAEIGDGCRLEAHAVVLGHTTLGPENRVFPGAVLGAEPQDLKHAGETTRLEVGARNTFREHVTVHAGTHAGGVVIGYGEGEMFVASDLSALLPETQRVAFLSDGEIARVTASGVSYETFEGVPLAKAGEYARHARAMRAAAVLVGAFLLSYALKLAFLGREEQGTWGRNAVWILRIHELCVFAMLIAGTVAGTRALRLRRTRNATRDPRDPPAPPELVRWHRGAGKAAVYAAALALGFAGLVLAGMYRRAGWF